TVPDPRRRRILFTAIQADAGDGSRRDRAADPRGEARFVVRVFWMPEIGEVDGDALRIIGRACFDRSRGNDRFSGRAKETGPSLDAACWPGMDFSPDAGAETIGPALRGRSLRFQFGHSRPV